MISKVVFSIKTSIRNWNDQIISYSTKDHKDISIVINNKKCELTIQGNDENDNLQYIILIWEILVWQDGYFYAPTNYSVNGIERPIENLVSNNSRITDSKWISDSLLLCRNHRQIDEEIVEIYRTIRYLDRKDKSMNASMFSSFFYLISESYSQINLEHRLVLLMHICDGFVIEYCEGSEMNNSGNINKIIQNINRKKYKTGACLLGISSSRAIEALGKTRNELSHYTYKSKSLGSFINNPDTSTDNMVNLYAFYVLAIVLRVAVLNEIGVNVTDEVKDYVMDDYLDWIKLVKHLDEDCVLPKNVLRQMIQKIQNQESKN